LKIVDCTDCNNIKQQTLLWIGFDVSPILVNALYNATANDLQGY